VVFGWPCQVGHRRNRYLEALLASRRDKHRLAWLPVGIPWIERYTAGIALPQGGGSAIAECAQARLITLILDARQQRANEQIQHVQCVVLGRGLEHTGERHQRGGPSVRKSTGMATLQTRWDGGGRYRSQGAIRCDSRHAPRCPSNECHPHARRAVGA